MLAVGVSVVWASSGKTGRLQPRGLRRRRATERKALDGLPDLPRDQRLCLQRCPAGPRSLLAEKWAVPLIAIATVALWLFARPGADRKWNLASSALCGAAVGLNQIFGKISHRRRPFATDPSAHVPGSPSHDPSFPSDHSSAAFGIAFAVFFFDRLVGNFFLAAATFVAVGRVFIGAQYSLDVLAGCLVGFGVALLIVRAAQPVVPAAVTLVGRITDPILDRLIWRRWSSLRTDSA